MTMTEEAFMAAVATAMRPRGMDPAACGFSLSRRGDRWSLGRGRSIYENDMAHFGVSALDATHVRLVAASLADWWTQERVRRGVIAAHDFVFAAHDDVHRPYLVDAVVARHFDRLGVGLDGFAEMMRTQIGRAPDAGGVIRAFEGVFSSFDTHVPDAFLAYRWRSGYQRLRRAFDPLGDIQFRMSGNGGGGLWAYLEIAPGAFWRGGPSPSLLLRGRDVPDTLLAAARGRHVADLIGHPTLEVDGLVMQSATRETERIDRRTTRQRIRIQLREVAIHASRRPETPRLAA